MKILVKNFLTLFEYQLNLYYLALKPNIQNTVINFLKDQCYTRIA